MKILSTKQIYEADKATMKNLPISSSDLMEKAGGKCTKWIIEQCIQTAAAIWVFCGLGNNGGDGLVISRQLIKKGFQVHTCIVNFGENRSADFKINFQRLLDIGHIPLEISDSHIFPEISNKDLVVDAIFGIGLSRAPHGVAKEVIEKINLCGARIISIDFPSGLFSSSSVIEKESVIRADHTLTFQNPKLAFFMPENGQYTAQWTVLDIGLDQDYIDTLKTKYATISKEKVHELYKPRKRFSHKGTFGHSLLIGGSFGKIGSLILASKAALKIGSGLVSAYIPKCGYTAMQASNPEIMVEVDDEKYLQFFNYKTRATAIGIGPGLGRHLKTKKGFIEFMKHNELPIVIDADALNIIAEHKELKDLIRYNTILTPHPKEFERLAGPWANDYEKIDKQLQFSLEYDCIVVLKGAYTSIASKGKVYFNTSGNPALATAGSGDVLTGIITGLLAQKYSPLEAAIAGVYIHGRTADIGVEHMESMETFIAMDCITHLGSVFKELQ